MEFKELNLHPDLQRGIAEAGYVTCMPVQEQVLVNAFNGQDLYVQSQTGTGKTAAFLVVIFQRLLTEDLLGGKKAIIMVPTRELAVQVEEEARVLGKYLPFKIGSFYGGVGYAQQVQTLRENAQILVGTPGRVLDLNKSGRMNLMDIAFLVLDEADRMFDMGFYPDLRKLIKVVPPADRRQTMLFSATLNAWVKNLAWEYTKNPFEIEIEPETVTVDEVDQLLYHVPSADKMRLLLGILEREKPESAIIFCNTKRYTEIVAKRLRMNGYECEFIIGDLPQARRLKVIDDVKAGNIHYLVATDVAARGLDIEGLAMVLNYDLPVESENYVHRIGRTARAGKTGRAITLASEQDVYELPDIEKYIGKKIPALIAGENLYAEDKSAGLRIRSDFFGDGFFGGRAEAGRGRRGERDRGERDSGRGGRDRTAREERRPGGRGPRYQDQAGQFEEAEGAARPGPGAAEDLSKLSFEQRMTYYRQKYKGQGPRPADQNRESPQAGATGAAGKNDREINRGRRKGPAPVSTAAPAGSAAQANPAGSTGGVRRGDKRRERRGEGRGEKRDEGQGRTAPGQAGASARSGDPVRTGDAARTGAETSRTGGDKPARGRPRNGKTSGHGRGSGNQATARDRGAARRDAANKTGANGQNGKGRAPRQDRGVPRREGTDAAAGKGPAAGSGKGLLGKLLSIFKRKE